MTQERILWTVLPNGLATRGGKKYLKLTVAVSPRCYGPGNTLSHYPDFVDWPASVAKSKFKFSFKGSGPAKVFPGKPDRTSPAADSTMWGYLFTGNTPVNPYKFQDMSQRFIVSYPAHTVYDMLKTEYQGIIAKYPFSLPSFDIMFQTLAGERNFGNGFPTLQELQNELNTLHDKQEKTLPRARTLRKALSQLELFYHRNIRMENGQVVSGYKPISPWPTTPQTLDFHEQVSSLTKFGELQRHLGLALDFLVPFSAAVPTGGNTTVQVLPPFLGAPNDINPKTFYTLNATQFLAKSSSGEVKEGMLNLADGSMFNMVQIDVDGGGLKLIGLIRQLIAGLEAATVTEARTGQAEQIGLPSLRSGGLAVLQTSRDVDLANVFPGANSNNTQAEGGGGGSLEFHAEDLTRGFRVDIRDTKTHKWHSLHERAPALDPSDPSNTVPPATLPGSYQFTNAPSGRQYFKPSGIDEGFTSMALTQDPNGAPSGGNTPDLYLHELLWRWMGWSLSAQRPNMYLGTDEQPTSFDSQPGPGVAMATQFGAAPGSLPKLRFGLGYWLRARVVDLAGNSLPPSSPISAFQVPKGPNPLVYRRFEPVVTPAVVLHDTLTEYDDKGNIVGASPGESVYRMVVRSNFDRTAAQELTYLAGTGPGDLGYTYLPPETVRWIASPRMSQIMAEHHEMFDLGSGWRSDALSIMKTYDNSFGVTTLPDGSTTPVAHGGSTLAMPYLPDVMAAGATFVGLPGGKPITGPPGTLPNPSQKLNFPGTWPDYKPFRVQLVGINSGKHAPHWDPTHRVLTVFLAKAGVATVRVSSFLDPTRIGLLGIWGWLEEYHAAGKISNSRFKVLTKAVADGLMWALTPYQEITFVNAVQQPLILPQFTNLTSVRGTVGQTDAQLLANPMPIDGPSTTKINVHADWVDPRDDLNLDPCPQPNTTDPNPPHGIIPGIPKEIATSQHVFEIPVSPTQKSVTFNAADNYRHKFGDTKHRFVNYTVVGTTRFEEYFPKNAQLATTRPSALSVPPEVTPIAKVNILSTARPLSPNILYAVPAFDWASFHSPKVFQTLRQGGWLRVYLDRTFYSSGEGELLGVVLINDKSQIDVNKHGSNRVQRALKGMGAVKNDLSGVTTTLEKYVTQWGMDPFWQSPGIMNPPMTTDFPAAAATMTGIYLEELGGLHPPAGVTATPVGVAGFPVNYDEDRCLYFADIQFNWGDSYYPFVRLALAVFQPNSITSPDTVHLSRVQQMDFVQLAPNRAAAVTINSSADPRFVKVAVEGVTPSVGFSTTLGTRIEVTLEQQALGISASSGELAWIPVPNADYVLTPSAVANSDLTIWNGSFDLPHPAGSVPYRLIFREYEFYPTEWGPYVPPSGPTSAGKDATTRQFDTRLVYAATVQI